MADRKRRGNGFVLGMLVYALAFLSLLLILLRPLWHYLAAYEDSAPDKAMDRYLESLDSAHIRELSKDFVSGLDLKLQSEEQAYQSVERSMSGELRYTLKVMSVDEKHAVYTIRNAERALGTVSIGKGEDPRFDFAPWEVEDETYDFTWLMGEDEITVPEDWTVLCNGVALDESYRIGESHYELLEDFYGDQRFTLPVLVTYRVDHVVGEAPFTLLDREGREVPREEERTDYDLLPNCTEEEQEQIRDLMDDFLQRYINCLSNYNRNIYGNYGALQPYIVPGSDIDRRVRDNMEGQQWAHSGGDFVTQRDDLLMMNLGEGYYLIEISYHLDTLGSRGHVESVNRAIIIMSTTNYGLKVIEYYSR